MPVSPAKMESSPEISVILPAYNEENLIIGTLTNLDVFLAERYVNYEIIVVDDGSIDQTSTLAAAWKGRSGKKVRLLVNPLNRGKGFSICRGMLESKGQWLVFMDADFPYELGAIDAFRQALQNGYDMAIGSRVLAESYVEGVPTLRFVAGQVFSWLVQALLFRGLPDTQCGFKAFVAPAARKIFPRVTITGFGFDVELLYLARKFDYKIKPVPVRMSDNYRRDSRVRLMRDSLRMFMDLFKIRWNDLCGRYNQPQG